jgi:hypothetical protein
MRLTNKKTTGIAPPCKATAAAATTWNFFPDAVYANCSSGDCSLPTAWSRANQTADPELDAADVAAGAGLLTIAVRDFYPAGPTLYFVPGAWCAAAYVNVTAGDVQGLVAAPPPAKRRHHHHRHLMTAAALPPPLLNVTDPCDLVSVTYSVSGAAPATLAVYDATSGVYKLDLGTDLPDGTTCVDITAIYATDGASFSTTPPFAAYVNGTVADTTAFTKTICLFKFTQQASAGLAFDMCTSDELHVNVSDVTPLPVNITLNGAGAPIGGGVSLLRPLIKVWGGKVAELDGTPSGIAYDSVEARDAAVWISAYLPLPASYAGEPASFPLGGPSVGNGGGSLLQEGVYNVSATVSLVTGHPQLVNLTGLNQITQDDAPGVSAGVTGMYEAAGRQVYDGVLVGVPRATPPTTLSALACTSHSSASRVAAGEPIVLTWQFRGAGSATCTHDGAPVSNAAGGKCVSPLTVIARSFGASAGAAAHTVNVTFTDVCGRERTADYAYTQAGVTALTPLEFLNADGTIKVTTQTPAARGGAGGAPAAMQAVAAFATLLATLLLLA